MISEFDLCYIAGFFDGEGSVSIARKQSKLNPTYSVDCTLTNTNKEVLLWIQKLFPNATLSKKTKHLKWRDCWLLHFRRDSIREFLILIRPYLKVRKSQVEVTLEFLDTCRYHGSESLTVKELALREILYEELLAMNKRGT